MSDVTALTDPVCGMTTSASSPHHHKYRDESYYFCGSGCREKFALTPDFYLDPHERERAAAAKLERRSGDQTYTCPMHPEVVSDGPSDCPLCGMALEPTVVTLGPEDDTELRDMARRFWVSAVLTLPLVVIAMGGMLSLPLASASPTDWLGWSELILATPVVFWCGYPFLVRGVQSVQNRHLNMFTLIAIGTSVAYLYSAAATVWPTAFPASFRDADGTVGVYFEAQLKTLLDHPLVGDARAKGRRRRLDPPREPQRERSRERDHSHDPPARG